MYSEDSSDDEFFDPEEEVAPPSPSWLTRQQSVGVGSTEDWGAGEARAGSGGDPGSSSPSAAAAGALDLSQLAATMPSVTGDEGPPPESDTPGAPPSPSPLAPPSPVQSSSRAKANDADVNSAQSPPAEHVPPAEKDAAEHHPQTPVSPTPDGASATPKSFEMEKVFRIKDLDTGQEFLVDEAAADRMLNAPGAAASSPGAAASTVKDLQTGEEISVEDFERSIGLSPLMREVNARERAAGESRGGGFVGSIGGSIGESTEDRGGRSTGGR